MKKEIKRRKGSFIYFKESNKKKLLSSINKRKRTEKSKKEFNLLHKTTFYMSSTFLHLYIFKYLYYMSTLSGRKGVTEIIIIW